MTVELLLITHDNIGDALLGSATGILGICPLHTETLAVAPDDSLEEISACAANLLKRMQKNGDVLILTDLLGSTPCNVAGALQKSGKVHVVAGLNLPMLIKVLSHPSLSLQRLTDAAIEGGRQGIRQGVAQTVYPLASSSG